MNIKRTGQRLTVTEQLSRQSQYFARPLAIESRLKFNPFRSIKKIFGLEPNANLGRRAMDVFDENGLFSPANHKVKIFTPSGFKLDVKKLIGMTSSAIDLEAYNTDKIKILAALQQYDYVLESASDRLRGDKEFMLEAIDVNYRAFSYALSELQKDDELIAARESSHDREITGSDNYESRGPSEYPRGY